MKTSETEDLFENWHKYLRFDVKSKIYNLTDKFHPYLVQAFIDEYKEHNDGLELDIKKFSGLDRTSNSPVISLGYDENGDTEFLVDGKNHDPELFLPTIGKIISSIKFSEIVDEIETTTKPTSVYDQKNKQLKTLNDFIFNINDKETFIQELKTTFPTERGKSIKAIIDILTDEQIIIYGTKEFQQLYTVIKNFFNRDIGTYNSVQNVKTVDKETTSTVYKKLNTLIIKHKKS